MLFAILSMFGYEAMEWLTLSEYRVQMFENGFVLNAVNVLSTHAIIGASGPQPPPQPSKLTDE